MFARSDRAEISLPIGLHVRNPIPSVCTMPTLGVGPIGERIARNVAELRARRGMSLRELSVCLGVLGRPILPSGIMKIEDGTRRVDADDLVALALALDVSPNRLLLPGSADTAQGVELTPKVASPTEDAAWRWAVGEYALFPLDAPTLAADVIRFMSENRPHVSSDLHHLEAEIAEHRDVLAPIAAAVREAQAAGVRLSVIMDFLRLTDALDPAEES
ncbi:helix-turn-helix domain-containing protein [Spongiactinospora gelatinilytica]|uniref:helix-turn-helix domain-containing protein n=1 Tax=Spongiactinospora gelatinilytica TaxID=2666298 RepID=UPI0018F732E2|nr:helix-turn-helix transcriptional regulator [Spongiactinospora gelatinilytica]